MPSPSTVIIDRKIDPKNIIKLSTRRTKKKHRVLIYVVRRGTERFDDTTYPDRPIYAKGFWAEDVSKEDWEFLRDRDYVWVLETTPDLENEESIQQWYDRWENHRNEISNRLLVKVGLDPKKYQVYGYDKTCLKPIPGLYEIRQLGSRMSRVPQRVIRSTMQLSGRAL